MKTRLYSILSFCALMAAATASYADTNTVGFSSVSMDDVVVVSNHKHMPGCKHSLAAKGNSRTSLNNTDNEIFSIHAVMRKQVVAGAVTCSCISSSTSQATVGDNACTACHRQPDYGAT